MDGAREDSKYQQSYGVNQGYGSSQNPKVVVHNVPYDEDDEEVDEDEEHEQEQEETNARDNVMTGSIQKNGDGEDDEHEERDNHYDDIDGDDEDDENARNESVNLQRHPKKRKLKSLLSSYEFAPRVPLPPASSTPKPSFGGRNTLTDWSEHETFVLLDAWGHRFLQCGRKSLRSEEWQEVADKVNQDSKIERTDSQCRNRLDTLKKKYKKERANIEGGKSVNTKWVYFKKMDMLMSSNPHQAGVSVSRGLDSGENVFLNLNRANGVDEMRDSVGNSNSQENNDDHDDDDDDDDDDDMLPPKKLKPKVSFKTLADSINKFSEIYEKIENSKIQQMIELEKMRMDFQRDLESHKRQILDRAQTEITKIQQGDYAENDVSAENASG